MNKQKKQVVIGVLIAFFLVVGVPLLINACYLSETIIFPTVWDGEDVLAYYGTILGAIVAVGTLSVTILFTRKQITSDRQREFERDSWQETEKVVDALLQHINPMRANELIDEGISRAIQGKNRAEKPLVDFHIKSVYLHDAAQARNYGTHGDFFTELCNDMLNITTQVASYRNYLSRLDDLVADYNESPDEPDKQEKYNSSFSSLNKEKETIFNELLLLHEIVYVPLIRKKQAEFEKIYQEINEKSDHILYF